MMIVRFGLAVAGFLCLSSTLHAEPLLQLYLEGAEYDEDTETWVLSPPGSSSGEPFRLWAIGNVAGPGGKGTIKEVRLAAAYDEEAGDGLTISFTPSTTGGLGNFDDPSFPSDPEYLQTVSDGSTPILGDGKPLPNHGEYGPGIVWQEFLLGDFYLEDSPIADFIGTFPTVADDAPLVGQINVYEVVVTGSAIHPTRIHFDLYNHVTAKNRGVFAPFSHDADGDVNIIPEPATLSSAIIALGLLGCLGPRLGRGRKQR